MMKSKKVAIIVLFVLMVVLVGYNIIYSDSLLRRAMWDVLGLLYATSLVLSFINNAKKEKEK